MDSAPSGAPVMWALPDTFQCFEADDSAAILADLVETFRLDTARRLGNLRTAVAAADFSLARAEAHSIKGSAWQMGAEALADACREIELEIDHTPAPSLAGRIDHLEVCFSAACLVMSAYAGGL